MKGRWADASAALQDILEELLDVLVEDLTNDLDWTAKPRPNGSWSMWASGIRVCNRPIVPSLAPAPVGGRSASPLSRTGRCRLLPSST